MSAKVQTKTRPSRAHRDVVGTLEDDCAHWRAVQARDAGFDGRFFYSVATTGVYCRPSCGARRPNRENVAFHATWQAAEAAGFRPCLRCHPRGPSRQQADALVVAAACRRIEAADGLPTLGELADAAGLSPSHFHRLFKAATGVTPRGYADAHRRQRVERSLKESRSVTDAAYDAGFQSLSRFYAGAAAAIGMTPTKFRAGGAGEELRFAVGDCSLGSLLVAQSTKGIAAILLGDEPEALVHELARRFPGAHLIGGDADFEAVVAKVAGLVEAPGQDLGLPLDIRGTAFQQRVWAALRKIPPGSTASYADIATRLGMPNAVRAVAAACAANALAVAIPCHRVVRKGGALAGYRWGIERKAKLLDLEKKVSVKR